MAEAELRTNKRITCFIQSLFFACILGVVILAVLPLFENKVRSLWFSPQNIRTLKSLPKNLSQGEDKWTAKNIKNYDIDVDIFEHPSCSISDTTVSVRDGKLVSALKDGLPLSLDDRYPLCSLSDFLPMEIFSTVGTFRGADPSKQQIEVEFDPEFGYVKHFLYRDYILDGFIEYTFTNFHPLDLGSP